MSISFINLSPHQTQQQQQFKNDVYEGLSSTDKFFPQKYLYDEEGSKIFAIMNLNQGSYLQNLEKNIIEDYGGEILDVVGGQKFNLIDVGAGDGRKTKIFVQKAVKKELNFEYISIDISQNSNKMLCQTFEELSNQVNMTIITSTFEQGIQWVTKNKAERNVYLMIGQTAGTMEKEQAVQFFKWLNPLLKQDDVIVLGIDMKKDPILIQNAYLKNKEEEFPLLLNSLKRMNKELSADFQLQKFYPHLFFNPAEGIVRGCLVSKQNQTVTIGEEKILFKQFETIKVICYRKWLQSEVDSLMELAGMALKFSFSDENDYFREVIYKKE